MIAGTSLLVAQGWWDGHMGWDGGWWILMALGMVLFWGLVVLGIVLVVRELTRGRGGQAGETDAMALLARRLAAGEISPEEYRERRAVLRDELRSSSDPM
jgi:putative membrane protein